MTHTPHLDMHGVLLIPETPEKGLEDRVVCFLFLIVPFDGLFRVAPLARLRINRRLRLAMTTTATAWSSVPLGFILAVLGEREGGRDGGERGRGSVAANAQSGSQSVFSLKDPGLGLRDPWLVGDPPRFDLQYKGLQQVPKSRVCIRRPISSSRWSTSSSD